MDHAHYGPKWTGIPILGLTIIMKAFKSNKKYTKGTRGRYGFEVDTAQGQAFQRRQGRSDYAATLINPELNLQVRVPDLACHATATFVTEYRQPLLINNTNTTANNGMLVCALSSGCPRLCLYQNQNGSVPGNLTVGTNVIAIGDSVTNQRGRFQAARLVSAMMRISYAGNDAQTEGSVIGTYYSQNYNLAVQQNAIARANPADWQNLPDYYNGPLKNGIVIRYKPVDAASFVMGPIAGNTGDVTYFGNMIAVILPTLATTSLTVQVEVVCNWEGILTNETTGIPIGISGADPVALAHGLNAAAGSATAFPSTASGWQKHVDNVLRLVH